MNDALFQFAHQLVGYSVWSDTLVIFCAMYLDKIVLGLTVIFLLFHKDYQAPYVDYQQLRTKIKETFFVFLSVFSAWITVGLLKIVFALPRPYLVYDITPLFTYGGFDSFPSGHATFFMALAVAVMQHHRGWGIVLAIGAVIISCARVIAGIHFPIDIFVGYFLGGILGYIWFRMYCYLRMKLNI